MTEIYLAPRQLPNLSPNQSIISARQCNTYVWPDIDRNGIREAHVLYDAGTHEIATKRYGSWQFLLLIKRKEPCAPRNYFNTNFKRDPA